MADQDPNGIVGGLMGMRDPDLLLNVGLGLMSAAKYGGNVGDGLSQALGNYQQQQLRKQQLAIQNVQMQRAQQMFPFQMEALRRGVNMLPGGQGAPQMPQGGPMPQGGAPQPQGMMTPTAQISPPQQGLMQSSPGSSALQTAGAGALLGLAQVPGADNLTKYGEMQAQYDPQLATQMAAAKDPIMQDRYLLAQAQQNGAPPLLIKGLQNKLLTDMGMIHVASQSGNVTTMGGLDPTNDLGVSTISPREGVQMVGGRESPIPGALGTRSALSAAEAGGKARYEPMELTDRSGNKYPVPKSMLPALVGAGANGAPGAMSSLGPGTSEMLKGNAESALGTNKGFQDQAEAGQQMLQQTATLRGAAANFEPGQFANSRMKMLNYLNSAGLITPEQAKSLGSAQEGQKIAIQLQAAATKQLGSREAAQIFQIMGKSLPNLELSKNGLDKVSGYMDGIARYNIARAEKAQGAAAGNDANAVNNVRNDFIKNSNPLYYIVASMHPAVQREMLDNMGGQRQSFLDGCKKAVQAGYAPRPSQFGLGAAQ